MNSDGIMVPIVEDDQGEGYENLCEEEETLDLMDSGFKRQMRELVRIHEKKGKYLNHMDKAQMKKFLGKR